MTVSELQTVLHEIIAEYFPNTPIIWAEQRKLVKPSGTFITLKLRNLTATQHSIKVTENNAPVSYKPSKMMLELQLFTHGNDERIIVDGEELTISVNTALNDIADLTNFLTSEYADAFYTKHDIALRPEGDTQDVSGLLDTNYEYRAMQEYVVEFTQTANGLAGITRKDWKPTASGGGTKELASQEAANLDADSIDIKNNF